MNQIEIILKSLPENARGFTECCNSKVCDPKLLENLDRGLSQGRTLVRNINVVLNHLAGLKIRLTDEQE